MRVLVSLVVAKLTKQYPPIYETIRLITLCIRSELYEFHLSISLFLEHVFLRNLVACGFYDEIFGFDATERLTRNKPGYSQIRETDVSLDPPHIIPLHSFKFLSRFSCEQIT